jgi:hypothetical protein
MNLPLTNLMLSVFLWLLLVEFLKLLHPTKSNPVNDSLIHAHHQSRGDDKFPVFIIDPVHCRSDGMRAGGKHFQLLAVMGNKVIDADCQIPDPFLVTGLVQQPERFDIDLPGWCRPGPHTSGQCAKRRGSTLTNPGLFLLSSERRKT